MRRLVTRRKAPRGRWDNVKVSHYCTRTKKGPAALIVANFSRRRQWSQMVLTFLVNSFSKYPSVSDCRITEATYPLPYASIDDSVLRFAVSYPL